MTLPTLTPAPGPTLDRTYLRLPEHYRTFDATAGHPLYRFMAGYLAELGDVETLTDRLGGVDDGTSDLADPVDADEAWLPWLAQLMGVTLDPSMDVLERRDAIQFASSGWRAGTKQAIADAVRSELTGTKFAVVYDHAVVRPGDGGVWDVLVVTRASETPNVDRVITVASRRGVKPAGVILRHRAYDVPYSLLLATYPTYGTDWTSRTYSQLQETGL